MKHYPSVILDFKYTIKYKLTPPEAVIMSIIDSECRNNLDPRGNSKGCDFENDYFAKLVAEPENAVDGMLSKLIKLGFLKQTQEENTRKLFSIK